MKERGLDKEVTQEIAIKAWDRLTEVMELFLGQSFIQEGTKGIIEAYIPLFLFFFIKPSI